jgi:PAS domain S-box-containing protein
MSAVRPDQPAPGERVRSPDESERIRLALHASGLGTWSWDATTGVVHWDETLEQMFGFAPGSFDGTYETYLGTLHPDDRDAIVDAVQRSLATAGEHRVEHRVIWPDGSIHWIEGWGRAIVGEDGAATGLVGVSLDITDRRRHEQRLEQLQHVTSALARARTIAEVGNVAVEELLTATGALVTTLLLVDDVTGKIRVVSTSMPDVELPEEWREFDMDSPLTGAEAIRTGRMVVRPVDVAQGPSAALARIKGVGEATTVMALPLETGGSVLGAVGMSLGSFDEDDAELQAFLATLGAQLGQALERAILHEREMQAAARSKMLADATSLLGRSLDYAQAIGQVARSAVPHMADWCVVDLLDEHDELQLLAVAHADPAKVELARRLRSEYPPDPEAETGAPAVVRTGKSELVSVIPPELIDAALREHPELTDVVRELQLTSAMTVPLVARGRVLGAMSFVWGESGRHYDEDDLAFAEELGRRAAFAIDNARLYSEQRAVADTLQASLRPPLLPPIDGLDLAAQYLPGGAHGEVAGDFYDVFQLREGSWLAVVGDVCGKGVPAAAVMALARYTIRTAALSRAKPSTILSTLNEALQRSELDRYCTACIVRLDAPDRPGGPMKVTVCAAGHPPPLTIGPEGSTFVDVEGPLLGIFDEPDLQDRRFDLDVGTTLVLYTDGVTEQRSEGELFGEDRLLDLAAELVGATAEQTAGRILREVSAFRPGATTDDIAILALRNVGT